MSTIFSSSINNSQSACESFISVAGYGTTLLKNEHSLKVETQSASVTASGSLWSQALMHLANATPLIQSEIQINESVQKRRNLQKRQALIQLLNSWREEDEEEQKDTWEYLKQALDEDRLSERKLFP